MSDLSDLLHPDDSPERQRDKLLNICSALMRRVEQAPDDRSNAYAQFERAALLDAEVRQRTADLEHALDLLNHSNAQLAEANREIETARSNLNEAIESVDEGFALFDVDDNLVLKNSRFCKDMPDVLPMIVPGMPFVDFVELVSQSKNLAHPHETTPAQWAKRRLKNHREQRVVFNITLTEDRWMQVSEHRTHEGGTVILQTDVTEIMREQRRERAQLVDSQARMLRATLDHLAQGVCIFDRDACLVGWNRRLEEMIRLPLPGPRIGLGFSRLLDLLRDQMKFTKGGSRAWLQKWADGVTDRAPITFELIGPDNQIFSVFAQEMPDEGFVISFDDVTQERQAAEDLRDLNRTLEQRVAERTEELGAALQEAERANESKNRFVAAASHDLLQPLSAAKLYLTSLQEMKIAPEATGISAKAESALESAEEIIEALLDISKLDAGRAAFDLQPLPLSQVLASLANEMSPAAAAKGLKLTVVTSSLSVVSDSMFFRRILQNLISNAIRYTDTGHVLVGVRRREGKARIEVHDTGCGIKPEDQDRIFQEFARLEPSNSGANGLGLGLAIVDRACASMGHRLDLVSTPGKGSCFAVEVELHQGGAGDTQLIEPAVDVLDVLKGKMLLLVENDEAFAHAMTLKLEGWGAHVLHTLTGEDAADVLAEIDIVPDALILDYQLGSGIDGISLCQSLRERYGPIPAFIVSANRSEQLLKECVERDLILLRKPVEAPALREALNLVLA